MFAGLIYIGAYLWKREGENLIKKVVSDALWVMDFMVCFRWESWDSVARDCYQKGKWEFSSGSFRFSLKQLHLLGWSSKNLFPNTTRNCLNGLLKILFTFLVNPSSIGQTWLFDRKSLTFKVLYIYPNFGPQNDSTIEEFSLIKLTFKSEQLSRKMFATRTIDLERTFSGSRWRSILECFVKPRSSESDGSLLRQIIV